MSTPTKLLETLGSEHLVRSTDDVLAMTLPLLEQVLEAHEQGRVAPLEGIDDVMVTNNRLWFERAKARPPKRDEERLRRLEIKESTAFDVVSHQRRVFEDHDVSTTDLGVGDPSGPIERPMYLSRYVSWEHEVGHHDALTDIYVLGLVLASVALDENLGERGALEQFVQNRSHLAAFGARLHPVVARAIMRMTEVDRHLRAQDLRSIIITLRNYREQSQDFAEAPVDRTSTAS